MMMSKTWTKEEISDRMVGGKIVKLTDEEKQTIADERTASEIEQEQSAIKNAREVLIRERMDKIVRDQAVSELEAEGVIT